MSETITERFQGVEPTFSFETHVDNGSLVAVDIYGGTPSEQGNTVVAYYRRPIGLEDDEFRADGFLHNQYDRAQGDLLRNMGQSSGLGRFGTRTTRYQPLVDALGYRWESVSEQDRGDFHKWVTFTYPSVATLNQVLDELSPGEGLRFEAYPGADYNAVEAIDALLRGKYLIADELSYQIHDHADRHVLGAIGLHGAYLEGIQAFAGAYYERYKAELQLPPVPQLDYDRVQRFLTPSHDVLRGLLSALDGY